MDWSDPEVRLSRSAEPVFLRAPFPPQVKPFEFQHAAVEYGVTRPSGNVIVGDAPGVGKTPEGVGIDNFWRLDVRRRCRTLAVVPASLRLNWEREVWKWSTQPSVRTYVVKKSSDGIDPNADWVIVSYSLLRNPALHAAIMELRWDHLILDEAHALKEPKGNVQVRAVTGWRDNGVDRFGVAEMAEHISLLSGTMLPNQPDEVYNAMRLLDWPSIDGASLADFRDAYYDFGSGMIRGPVWDKKKQAYVNKAHWSDHVRNVPTNLEDLQWRLRKHLMIRRTKRQKDMKMQLPPRQWNPFALDVTGAIKKAFKHPGWKEVEALYDLDPENFESAIAFDGAAATAIRELGEAKAPGVASYVEELLAEGRKVVVGAWHRSVLAILRERLERYGLVYMDGSTSVTRRQAAVDAFQDRDEIRVALGQIKSIGEGWTLTAAEDVVNAEPRSTPGVNDQLFDRIDRHGQTGERTMCHLPIVPGTLDERMVARAVERDRSIFLAMDAEYD